MVSDFQYLKERTRSLWGQEVPILKRDAIVKNNFLFQVSAFDVHNFLSAELLERSGCAIDFISFLMSYTNHAKISGPKFINYFCMLDLLGIVKLVKPIMG